MQPLRAWFLSCEIPPSVKWARKTQPPALREGFTEAMFGKCLVIKSQFPRPKLGKQSNMASRQVRLCLGEVALQNLKELNLR